MHILATLWRVGAVCLFVSVLVFISSCAIDSSLKDANTDSGGKARVLFYVHMMPGRISPPMTLMLKDISMDGAVKSTVFSGEIRLDTQEILKNQLFLAEAHVAPGEYGSITLSFGGGKDVSLKVPLGLVLSDGQSAVIALEWNANALSPTATGVFSSRAQEMIPASRMVLVSNYEDGYLSVIDKDTERVVAAVSVGRGPTSVVFSSERNVAYVLNSTSGTISVVDLGAMSVADTIGLHSGIGAFEMVASKGGAIESGEKLYVVNADSEDITVVETRTKVFLKNIKVGRKPSHIAANPYRKEIYVTNEWSNDVTVVSNVSDSVAGTFPVSLRPVGLVVDSNDVYVLSASERSVSVHSLSSRKEIGRLYTKHSPARGVILSSERIFIVMPDGGEIMRISGGIKVPGDAMVVGKGPFGIAADEYRNRLFVANRDDGTVSVVNYLSEKTEKTLRVGKRPYAVAVAGQ